MHGFWHMTHLPQPPGITCTALQDHKTSYTKDIKLLELDEPRDLSLNVQCQQASAATCRSQAVPATPQQEGQKPGLSSAKRSQPSIFHRSKRAALPGRPSPAQGGTELTFLNPNNHQRAARPALPVRQVHSQARQAASPGAAIPVPAVLSGL